MSNADQQWEEQYQEGRDPKSGKFVAGKAVGRTIPEDADCALRCENPKSYDTVHDTHNQLTTSQ